MRPARPLLVLPAMLPDRDATSLCSCCSALGVRYDFIVLSSRTHDDHGEPLVPDDLELFVQRLSAIDQAAVLSKLRHIHR